VKVIQSSALNLKFVKKKVMDISNSVDLQSQTIYDDPKKIQERLHILEDGASGVQAGDIEQVIV
jgi:hypothetical protein